MRESTIIVGDFNTPLAEMDRSSRKESINDIAELIKTINQLGIREKYKLHSRIAEKKKNSRNMFFSSSHGPFTNIDHTLGHKTCFNKFKSNINHTMFALRPQ